MALEFAVSPVFDVLMAVVEVVRVVRERDLFLGLYTDGVSVKESGSIETNVFVNLKENVEG